MKIWTGWRVESADDDEPCFRKVVPAEMIPIQPRFEFRAWANRLDAVHRRIRALSECHRTQETTDIYIVSTDVVDVNPKIREGELDIKVLIAAREGFEQWEPRVKLSFPVPAALMRDEVFPMLGRPAPDLGSGTISTSRFLTDVVQQCEGMTAVEVAKRRHAFTVDGCITEFAEISIAGTDLQTASIESVDIEALRDARRLIGLDAYDNISYPAAVKSAIGWTSS